MKFLQDLLNWSEAWAPLIPLAVYILYKPKPKWTKPIVIYLVIAVILGTAVDVIWQRKHLGIDWWFQENLSWWYEGEHFKNTIFYNFLSLARLLFFTWFFGYMGSFFKRLNRFIPAIFVVLLIVNFKVFEDIKVFSSRQHAFEVAILLFYSLVFFYKVNMDDSIPSAAALPQFWFVTGLTLYAAINFFIFLFYNYLMEEYVEYAVEIWNVHNISYIVLNILMAIAFFRAR